MADPDIAAADQRRAFWVELAVAFALGLTAIATAWAGYKAAVVRDDAASAANQGVRTLNLASIYLLHSDQLLAGDRLVFRDYKRALRTGGEAAAAVIQREDMRPELQRETAWWRKQKRGLYPTPFVKQDPAYHPQFLIHGREARVLSRDLFAESDRIDSDANRYELITVILAASLFLLGVAGVMRDLRFRIALLVMGVVILLLAAADLGRLAAHDVHFSCAKFLTNVERSCG
jgi:hypothetical protein